PGALLCDVKYKDGPASVKRPSGASHAPGYSTGERTLPWSGPIVPLRVFGSGGLETSLPQGLTKRLRPCTWHGRSLSPDSSPTGGRIPRQRHPYGRQGHRSAGGPGPPSLAIRRACRGPRAPRPPVARGGAV